MHIIVTHVYVCPKQVVWREKWHSSLFVKIAKHNKAFTSDQAYDAMATTIIIDKTNYITCFCSGQTTVSVSTQLIATVQFKWFNRE